jgi:hypothetical protein
MSPWERFQRLLDRVESRWSLTVLFCGTGALGLISAKFAAGAAWLSQYGPLAWWFATLVGFCVSALAFAGIAVARNQWLKGSALRKWKDVVDSFNPLDENFTKLRIRLSELANPITKIIEGKRITDCELLGPANIAFINNGTLTNNNFIDCDIVAARRHVTIRNVISLTDVHITHSKLINCTLFCPPDILDAIMAMPGSVSLALTGNAEYDQRTNRP